MIDRRETFFGTGAMWFRPIDGVNHVLIWSGYDLSVLHVCPNSYETLSDSGWSNFTAVQRSLSFDFRDFLETREKLLKQRTNRLQSVR